MSKEELETTALEAWDRFKMGRHLLPPKEWFFCGYRTGAKWQASHTPAVSVEVEKAAEDYADSFECVEAAKEDIAEHILAGFQARSPLVELLREAVPVLRGERHQDINELAARINAALKGEK